MANAHAQTRPGAGVALGDLEGSEALLRGYSTAVMGFSWAYAAYGGKGNMRGEGHGR
jgi:hypothetical protein